MLPGGAYGRSLAVLLLISTSCLTAAPASVVIQHSGPRRSGMDLESRAPNHPSPWWCDTRDDVYAPVAMLQALRGGKAPEFEGQGGKLRAKPWKRAEDYLPQMLASSAVTEHDARAEQKKQKKPTPQVDWYAKKARKASVKQKKWQRAEPADDQDSCEV